MSVTCKHNIYGCNINGELTFWCALFIVQKLMLYHSCNGVVLRCDELTSAVLPVTMSTININDVTVHTKMADSTSSLSLINLYQPADVSVFIVTGFLTASSSHCNAVATVSVDKSYETIPFVNLPGMSASVSVMYFLANTEHEVYGIEINVSKHLVSAFRLLLFLKTKVESCDHVIRDNLYLMNMYTFSWSSLSILYTKLMSLPTGAMLMLLVIR